MAIKTEFYRTREDGVNLYRTYSDAGKMIRKVDTDEIYGEAIDVENRGFTYEETDEPIEPSEEPESVTYDELVQIYTEGVNGIDE
jgi:hypothetical protein